MAPIAAASFGGFEPPPPPESIPAATPGVVDLSFRDLTDFPSGE